MPFRRFNKNTEGLAPNVLPIATSANIGVAGDSANPGTPDLTEIFASDPDGNYPLVWNIPGASVNGNTLQDAGPGSLGSASRYVYVYGNAVAGADSYTFTVTDTRGGVSNVATITFTVS